MDEVSADLARYLKDFDQRALERSHAGLMRGAQAILSTLGVMIPAWPAVLALAGVHWAWCVAAPYVLWLLSLWAAWYVLLPGDYEASADLLRGPATFRRLLHRKMTGLHLSAILFGAGLVAAGGVFAHLAPPSVAASSATRAAAIAPAP